MRLDTRLVCDLYVGQAKSVKHGKGHQSTMHALIEPVLHIFPAR